MLSYHVQSSLPVPPLFRNGSIGREYNLEKRYLRLEMGAVLGGRRYWEGGGIGREAVLGGRRYVCVQAQCTSTMYIDVHLT